LQHPSPGDKQIHQPDKKVPPKILFIINSLCGGGAERVMAKLIAASESRRGRFDMSIALLDEEAQAYPLPDWIRVHRLDCDVRLGRSLVRLRRLVARERPEATLSFLNRANVSNGFAMFGRQRPWLISERVDTSAHLGSRSRALFSQAIVRFVYPRATRVIAVSEGVAEGLIRTFKVPAAKVRVIHNPVDLSELRASAAEVPSLEIDGTFVMGIGRLVPKKNFAMMIEAFARSGIEGKLVIAGEGPERPALQALAERLGLAERVVLPGFLANPHALLARASFYASSSNNEGFPNALVEAMALGVPAVSTNCPSGPSEILAKKPRSAVTGLEVGDYGILSPVGDADSMAEAFRMLSQPALRKRLAASGTERVADFSVERAVDLYWSAIEGALRETE
jgi:N-acetylgalactosamine-N,N'-diacetylbacillosaminyl-diphospho-undecaprenol 4-alpha-N-acetylgalactosaminyltransferase